MYSNHPRWASRLMLILVPALLITAGGVHASNWPGTTEPNVALSTAFDRQEFLQAASDGAGGAIVVWQDLRNQLDHNIFAQRVDAWGNVLWAQDGVSVCSAVFEQIAPQVIADGAGGAIVVWEDSRGGSGKDIYAQRLDADGNPLWTLDGGVVTQAIADQQFPRLVSDGAGGAIVVWEDIRTGAVFEVYAQRIDANGTRLWNADGNAITTTVWNRLPDLASDGAGGAVIAWDDYRGAFTAVYAQRVNASGSVQWTANGVAVRSVGWDVSGVHVVPSLANGAMILWENAQFADHDLVAARVIGDGTVLPVTTVSGGLGHHSNAHVVSDGAGGLLVAYTRDIGGDNAIAVQRLQFDGTMWNNGLPETFAAPGNLTERNPRLTADASGGCVVVWEDDRNGTPDLFAVGLANEGSKRWPGVSGGQVVTTAIGNQFDPQLVTDDNGGAIVVWHDERVSAITDDIYAQRVEGLGHIGYPSGDITSIVDVPQDNGGNVTVSWSASDLDVYPGQTVTHYSIWRSPGPSAVAPAGAASRDIEAAIEAAVAAGVGPELATQMAAGGWNFVDTQTATWIGEYSYNAPTYGDSTGAGESQADYMVIAQTSDQFVFWKSRPSSGYSVDNLAPSSPLNLTGQTVGNDAQLDWEVPDMNNEDITQYNVYRSQLTGVAPTPGNFLTSVPDLTLLDITTGGLLHFYVVTAVDLSEHESVPSNEVAVPIVTGIGDRVPAVPRALTLMPNAPNPFSNATTFRFGLPANASVSVEVFDVAGRLVFRDRVSNAASGWNTYAFDGKDTSGERLPSGVYLLRMTGSGNVQTRKMMIMR